MGFDRRVGASRWPTDAIIVVFVSFCETITGVVYNIGAFSWPLQGFSTVMLREPLEVRNPFGSQALDEGLLPERLFT